MFNIEKNKDLSSYTTLRVEARAKFFSIIKSIEDFQEALAWAKKNKIKIFILGGGSNILITKKMDFLVLKNEIKGIEIVKENKKTVIVEGKSGEIWTRFVNFTVQKKLYGLENLFLIYGTVGAAPIQNIGAYGVELKDVFQSLEAFDLRTGKKKTFSLKDCQFSYRDSIFKHKFKNRYFIYSLRVKLERQGQLKLSYGVIRQELALLKKKKPGLEDLVSVIAKIRNSKLPSPALFPNAGSFFKNVELNYFEFKKILKKYPDIPYFPLQQKLVGKLRRGELKKEDLQTIKKVKIPSAWLIEQAGFKGKRIASVGISEKQALILINYGGARPQEILSFIKKIKKAVYNKFSIKIEEEVIIV